MSANIPKIIHQIWIGNNQEPKQYTNTWRNYIIQNKEYKYMFWDNKNVDTILKQFPQLSKLFYVEKEWCGKADILRYMILYIYGGIYIDADCVWINNKSLDDLIKVTDTNMFAGLVPEKDYINNAVIGCTPKNKNIIYILKFLRQYTVQEYINIRKKKPCHIVTGPQLITKIQHNIKVFPSYYFYPIRWHGLKNIKYHLENNINTESYMFHYGISTNNLDVN